jgi:uncharacterized protein (TIGR02646 family)
MIKYDLPPEPSRLTEEKAELTRIYHTAGKDVWNRPWLKMAVFQKSFGKCCYSDIKLGEESKYMEIDHFLPKSIYPDLAVEWDNLNPSCKTCNAAKGDHDPGKAHIVNPFRDDPKEYLYFKDFRYYGNNEAGKNTIRVLGLNNLTHFVLKRARIGLKIREDLKDLFDERTLFLQPDYRRRKLSTLKKLMRQGDRHEAYAALTATVIMEDEHFRHLETCLRNNRLWDTELDALKAELTFCALLH